MEILILFSIFILLLLIRVPIAMAIAISSTVLLMLNLPYLETVVTISQRIATGLDSFTLLAIPLFVLAGEIMNRGGIAHRLIAFAKALVGMFPGGMAYINIFGNMLFGAISGSAAASASAIGSIMKKPMQDSGYTKEFSASVNVISSTTGLIIPPSNVLIIYSLASGGVSIAALFLAGYIPGLLIGLVLVLIAYYYSVKKGIKGESTFKFDVLIKTFVDAFPSFVMLLIVIGGIIQGIFTATEASAIAVVYSLLISLFVYKEVKIKDFYQIAMGSAKTIGIVLLLVCASMALSWVMSYNNIPQDTATALLQLSDNKYVILFIINMILLVIGIFMDITPAILIFTPIFLPALEKFDVNLIHFGIMMVLNLCIGLCTPPVGNLLFIGCSVGDVRIRHIIKPLIPFYIGMILILLLVTFVPAISLWLPSFLGF